MSSLRPNLAARHGQRVTVTATFIRYGLRPTPHGQRLTALLHDLHTPDGVPLAAYVWCREASAFAGVRPGHLVTVTATVYRYRSSRGVTNYSIRDVIVIGNQSIKKGKQ